MSSNKTHEFTTARLKELAQIVTRQGITFVLFVAAFGNLENIFDQSQYTDLLLVYNYGLLICGFSLLGYPTLLQHRFSTSSTAGRRMVSQFMVIIVISLAISIAAVSLISTLHGLSGHLTLGVFLFLYTVFTQLLAISYGKGNIHSINLAELLGVTIFFTSTVFMPLESLNQVFLIIAISYALRCLVLLARLLTGVTTKDDELEPALRENKISFWEVSAISAANILIFRSILPLSESHNTSSTLPNPLILIWPLIERVLSITATLNAILYRYIARGEMTQGPKNLFQGGVLVLIPLSFAIVWASYGYIYDHQTQSGTTYFLVLSFVTAWSLKSYHANVFVAAGRLRFLLMLASFQLSVVFGLYVFAAQKAVFGVDLSLAVICVMLLITCVVGVIAQKHIEVQRYGAAP